MLDGGNSVAQRGWAGDIIKGRVVAIAALSLALAIFASALGTTGARAQPQTFTIPAQSVESALKEFARQADIEVLFTAGDVAELASPGVSGAATRGEALSGILDGTGLVFEFEAEDLLIVRVPAEGAEGSGRINSITPSDNGSRLAQASGTQAAAEDDDYDDGEESIEEVIVTGSHIRGTEASIGSKLEVVTRLDIERGGFGTVPEVLHSLTNNFKGGINEDTRSAVNDANLSGGTSINLRGLGAGNTLTLVNGRRLAAGGLTGSFVDISNIPASLIERIEVLADGASATYGSDAIGGVVNIILRDDFDGAETSLRIGTVTEGGSQEYRASQTFGRSWNAGHALISYEYYKRESLGYEDRRFTADSDLTSLGGDDFGTEGSVPGNITNFVDTFAIPSGQDGTSLTVGDLLLGQVNLFNQNQSRDLLKNQERHSVFITASQELGERLELFAEGRFGNRNFQDPVSGAPIFLVVPSSNPFFVDPFGGSPFIFINYNTLVDFGGAVTKGSARTYNGLLGIRAVLWGDWQLQAYGSYSSERRRSNSITLDGAALGAALADSNPTTAFNPFGDGSFQQNPATINSILIPLPRHGQSDIWSGNLIADGSLFQMPGGPAKLAVGASYDRYSLDSFADSGFGIRESVDKREVVAFFGEMQVPFFDQGNNRAGLERLIFTASVRHEDYDDVGTTTNPKLGVLWTPIEGLDIRGTWGTSFRAPDLEELDDTFNLMRHFLLPDQSGSTLSLLVTGKNSDLKNETAESWTVGFDYSVPSVPGLEFDLTYYHIDFEDRIASASIGGIGILLQEDRFASAITRNPAQALIDEFCNSGITFLSGDLNTCLTTPIGAIVDWRLINTGQLKTDGFDFNVRYGFETASAGRFDFHVGGTYILSFEDAFGPTAPVTELVDTVGNPIGLRLRNSATWSNQRGLSASAFLNYSDSYTDNVSIPEREISSWATVDLTLAYNTKDRLRSMGLNDALLSLSVRNILDTDPPFVNNPIGVGYDPENDSPLGRFISFNITKKW